MITAGEARILSSKMKEIIIKKELKNIDKLIKLCIQRGELVVYYNTPFHEYKKDIMKKLEDVGYRVQQGYDYRNITIYWS